MDNYTEQEVEQYTREVKDIVANYKSYGMIFKKKSHLKNFVEVVTSPFLSDPFYTFRTKLYWVVNDLKEFPRCRYCNKPLKWKNVNSVKQGYPDFCCNSHGQLMRKNHSDNPYVERTDIADIPLDELAVMSNSDILNKVNELNLSSRGMYEILTHRCPNLYSEIEKRTQFLNNGSIVPMLSRLYCLKHDIHSHPICSYSDCHNEVQWDSKTQKFKPYCSPKCRANDPEFRKKVEEICLQKFGTKSPIQSEEIKRKYRNTCMNKWGVENFAQTAEHQRTKRHKFTSPKYPGMSFASTWEMKVFDYCKENDLTMDYQPAVSIPYEYGGKKHTYHPDFFIEGKYYEVKGDQFFKVNESGKEVMTCPFRNPSWSDEQYEHICGCFEAKHQCMLKNNVTILRRKDINNLQEVFKDACTQ